MGMMLEKKLKSLGVDVVFHSNGQPNAQYKTAQVYLIERLRK
jgi:hypothetical protein